MKRKILFILIFIITLLSNFYISVLASEEVNTETLNVVAKNLSFRDSVCIKFAVDTKDPNTVLLVWSEEAASGLELDDFLYGTQTSILSTVGYDPELGADHLIYDYTNLSAKEMTDNVYVRGYLDGKYGKVEKYSILQYCFNMLNKIGEEAIDENLRNLITASLSQGAAAQVYFNYKTDHLANDNYYQIKLNGGTLYDGFDNGLFLENETVILSASEFNSENIPFYCWENASGDIVSKENVFSLNKANENETFTAVYNYVLDYTLNDDSTGYIVTGIGNALTQLNIEIPSTYEGLPVVSVGENAFSNCNYVKSISIPDSITSIGVSVFSNSENLETINYFGTKNDWDIVLKEKGWDNQLNAQIKYTGSTKGLQYTLNDDGISYTLSGIGKSKNTDIVVPSSYNNLPVTVVAESAFNYVYRLTSIVLLKLVLTHLIHVLT